MTSTLLLDTFTALALFFVIIISAIVFNDGRHFLEEFVLF